MLKSLTSTYYISDGGQRSCNDDGLPKTTHHQCFLTSALIWSIYYLEETCIRR